MNMELYGTLRILRFVGQSVGTVQMGLQHLSVKLHLRDVRPSVS